MTMNYGNPDVLWQSNIPANVLELINRGKVRDNYRLLEKKPARRLINTTDRISAFDVKMPEGIPDKGRVLTQISLFWFELLKGIVPNHLITADFSQYPTELTPYRSQLDGRSMLVKEVDILQVECIVRGYISGSLWKEYKAACKAANADATFVVVNGVELPLGLRESDKLPAPIFTPSTKAESGHDENISFARACEIVGVELATKMRDKSIALYVAAANYALGRGIIIADTKFEFGIDDQGTLILADEVLTPDSSRFWDVEKYQPGRAQDSFDKQYLRDYLETLDWDKTPPPPHLPEEVIVATRAKYLEAYYRLTGIRLAA